MTILALIILLWSAIGFPVCGWWVLNLRKNRDNHCGVCEAVCVIAGSGPLIWFCALVAYISVCLNER